MLTGTALRNFKPKAAPYKASDRDGMYVTVSTAGTIAFRYDDRLNGRRETLTLGRYGPAGISLALAREKLWDAKRAVARGESPAHEKQREKTWKFAALLHFVDRGLCQRNDLVRFLAADAGSRRCPDERPDSAPLLTGRAAGTDAATW